MGEAKSMPQCEMFYVNGTKTYSSHLVSRWLDLGGSKQYFQVGYFIIADTDTPANLEVLKKYHGNRHVLEQARAL